MCPLKPIGFMVGDPLGMAVAKVNLQARVWATKLSGFFSTWEVCFLYHAWRVEAMMKFIKDGISGWPPISYISKDNL